MKMTIKTAVLWAFGCFFLTLQMAAQAPNRFNYQAYAIDATTKKPYTGTTDVIFTIKNLNINGTELYKEKFSAAPIGENGLFSLQIGTGMALSGAWSSIDWANGAKFLKVEIDPASSGTFIDMGTQELVSVPFAMLAQKSTEDKDNQTLSISGNNLSILGGNQVALPSPTPTYWAASGNNISNSNSGNVGIGISAPVTKLHVNGTGLFENDIVLKKRLYAYDDNTSSGHDIVFGNNNSATIFEWIGSKRTTGGNQFGIDLGVGGSPALSIWHDHHITMNGALFVNGTANSAGEAFAFYAKSNIAYTGIGGGVVPFSIKAKDRIWATEFNAYSDLRIKNILHQSSPQNDLATLLRLKVTDYTHKDVATKGIASKKGFIAQEVEQEFAEAVTKGTDFIPDVYQAAKSVEFNADDKTLTISLEKRAEIAVGDRVRLFADKQYEVEVSAVSGTSFTVKNWEGAADTKEVFVFGKEVHDFRTVDYDRIFTLNVSATQELAHEVVDLKAENAALRARIDGLESKMEAFFSKTPTADVSPTVGSSNK